jgi:hypothetical protein
MVGKIAVSQYPNTNTKIARMIEGTELRLTFGFWSSMGGMEIKRIANEVRIPTIPTQVSANAIPLL